MAKTEPLTPEETTSHATAGGHYALAIRGSVSRALFVALATMSVGTLAVGSALVLAAPPVPVFMVAALGLWAAVFAVARRLSARIADAVSAPAQALLDDAARDGATDATPRALPDAALPTLRNDLEALSAGLGTRARASAQTVAELVRIKEHAQAANLAKSQFLANIGHDLRTPLNAIVGYATLLQEDAVAEGRAAHDADLQRILEASRRLIEMISDVLDLSNIETGKLAFQPGILDVAALVTGVAAHVDPVRNGNRLCVDVPADIGIMVGDEAKLRRALRNVVANAFRYTRNGDIDLIVAGCDVGGVDHICFSVSDTGPGMTVEQIALAFDPFATGSNGGGSGLGLAVTRRLVRVMGGDVTATSVPGEGTSFRIVLPRKVARGLPSSAIPDYVEAAPADALAFDKIALVIDDDHTAVALMRRRLAPHGYGVIAAHDGAAGLALARSEKPDLIVLDIHMPVMNGYQVLEAIRADEAIRAIPVVVATVDDDRGRVLRSGASDYLAKPVGREQLTDVLNLYRDRVDGEILIVDDDPDAGDLIARTATEVGLASRRAFDGRQALAMIRDHAPSAIVMDLTMPGLSGFALLEKLREDQAAIPIVIVSGRALTDRERDMVTASGHPFFTKGEFSPRQVAQTLKSLLNKPALAA